MSPVYSLLASGCTVLLYNDEHTLNFNASRQSPEDIALLECFKMSQVGLFHVEVSVVRQDGLEKLLRNTLLYFIHKHTVLSCLMYWKTVEYIISVTNDIEIKGVHVIL